MKTLDELKTKKVKVNNNNYWLIQLLYGDAAEDLTATFQIPDNIYFKKI